MCDALVRGVLEGFGEFAVHGGADANVEAAADESESERFGGPFGEFDADAAKDALARFEEDVAGMMMLLEGAALAGESVETGAVGLSVILKFAVAGGPAIAMETPSGLLDRFGGGVAECRSAGG